MIRRFVTLSGWAVVAVLLAGTLHGAHSQTPVPFKDGTFVLGQDGSANVVSGGVSYPISFTTDDGNALAGLPVGPSVSTVGELSRAIANAPMPSAGQSLRLLASGFVQDRTTVEYIFVVDNQNDGIAITNVKYQVVAYDAAGTVLGTSYSFDDLPLVLPHQRMAEANRLQVPSSVVVARIDVQLGSSTSVMVQQPRTFDVLTLTFKQTAKDSITVTGTITNPYPVTLRDFSVIAVAFDSGAHIVGSSEEPVALLPPNGKAAVEFSVDVTTASSVKTVELYTQVGSLAAIN